MKRVLLEISVNDDYIEDSPVHRTKLVIALEGSVAKHMLSCADPTTVRILGRGAPEIKVLTEQEPV